MASGSVVGASGFDSSEGESTTRHHGSTPSACAGSTGSPRRGITSCAPALGLSSSKDSAGWSQACIARLNVPQCTGRKAPPPSNASAFSAFSGPRCMSPHEGWRPPTSSITRSNGPSRSRIVWYSVVRPVSPLKKTACRSVRTTKEDHNVELRLRRPRPEKCCEGAAVTVSSAFGSLCDSHQSSSTIRSGLTPPVFEVRADAERGYERHDALGDLVDRRIVEVVVVVVRDDHEVYGRHRAKGYGH